MLSFCNSDTSAISLAGTTHDLILELHTAHNARSVTA